MACVQLTLALAGTESTQCLAVIVIFLALFVHETSISRNLLLHCIAKAIVLVIAAAKSTSLRFAVNVGLAERRVR